MGIRIGIWRVGGLMGWVYMCEDILNRVEGVYKWKVFVVYSNLY